jgi:2-phospho-L-lactate guanylyltransferase
MAVFAIIPVKNLEFSKKRLSVVLSPQERSLLTLAMLEDVLKALQLSVVDEIVVIGNDAKVQCIADRYGAFYLTASQDGLNSAIEQAVAWCVNEDAGWVLILPADMPLLEPADVNQIVELGISGASVVLSPSPDGGTNALFQSTPTLVRACFGPKSFAAHIQEACFRGAKIRFYGSLNIAHDIDSAEDLKKLFEVENNTLSKDVLEQIMLRNQVARNYIESKA